ncbi:MAG: leucine--tRNA ligase [Candidatus Kerfeldbacteria bacterium]|nr:leucine--tRNA ligase [Candidatus Kerfeldbacteria bacterium]
MKNVKSFDHRQTEKRWQRKFERANLYRGKEDSGTPHAYILDMFPYPSGVGLHVGHPKGYIASDIVARFTRMNGSNVLHPMGWDAFGLPAENYAIKQGIHPQQSTNINIQRFKQQIQSFFPSIDWSREMNTSDPSYYRWTQWLFLQMYKHGLAYKKEAPVNWCPSCQTVLANEQVIAARCERCGSLVEQKLLSQWFWKITDYAEQLLTDLATLDWPEKIKTMQVNWIGKHLGAEIPFTVLDSRVTIEVFTTRPDTLFGVTYLVLAPEHPLVGKITPARFRIPVEQYQKKTAKKTRLERTDLLKEKTGVFTGAYAMHPLTHAQLPIWVSDFVVPDYGTGSVMAVPAHDPRDFAFATQFDLPIRQVISPDGEEQPTMTEAYTGTGFLIHSADFNATRSEKAGMMITKAAKGKPRVCYRLRDWLVSRQRYWGAPIPMIECAHCGTVPVPEKDLPVLLPTDVDFRPTGESPLVRSKTFHRVKCPTCKKSARREVDTMDTFVCSSWYFLRFCDSKNTRRAFEEGRVQYWMPVDVYVGGAEHAVLHLMYARFVVKALRDFGHLKFDEPFLKLRSQGHILGPDNQKMSKSKGNVINPDDVITEFGADTFRLYEMFMGPFEDSAPWDTHGIIGVRRFVDRVYEVGMRQEFREASEEEERALHQTIQIVGEHIPAFRFNTAVSQMMIFMQFVRAHGVSKESFLTFLQLMSPFAPVVTQELWESLGEKGFISQTHFPNVDPSKLKDSNVTIAVSINGKVRGQLTVPNTLEKEALLKQAKELPNVARYVSGKTIRKEIIVPNRMINFVI